MSNDAKRTRNLPLAGVRVLVGRARHQAGVLSTELRGLGAEVLEIPFIEIRRPKSFRPLDTALKSLGSYDWLILTSVNGVEAMWERMEHFSLTPRDLKHLSIAAIGPATKKAIEKRGAHVDVVPEKYIAESVVQSLKGRVEGKRVLLVRAKVARDVIPNALRKAGSHVEVVEAYETVVPKTSRVRLQAAFRNPSKRPHLVTFTSSSTVKNFVGLLGSSAAARNLQGNARRRNSDTLSPVQFASIGPVTSSTLREFKLRPDIEAEEFTIPGLVTAIKKATRRR